jgi:mono/diheme cytochrome c family protein/glucose/arabinose dehydrogenase
MRTRRYIACAFVFAALATGISSQEPTGNGWPPSVQQVRPESPALPPAEALKTFSLPPGYRLELVASEPLVQDPVVMDWDAEGRIWVVEMPGFVQTLVTPEPNLDPIGRVVVLEDTNHDGVMDKRTVFADGLILARALKVLEHGVLVGEPPNLWLMRDTNGDLHADTRELVTNRYGRREGRVEENANDLHWGLDNWIHTADSDMYLRLTDGKFEVRDTLVRGEWGVTHDDAGRIFRNTNEEALHVDLVPTPYYARNPNLARTRGSYEELGDESIDVVWPIRPNPGTNRAYQKGIDRPDGTLAKFTSACAPLIYRGDRLPAELHGNAFIAEPAANVVSRIVLTTDGATMRARKAYERGEFIASTDERFRPVYLSNAPDGTLYVVDMYRGVIQQRADVTQYLRDHIVKHELERPTGLGRIYRVMHETTTRDTSPAGFQTSAGLVAALSHPNGWRRDTAQQLLVERRDTTVVPDLIRLIGSAPDWRTRLHALWALDGMDAVQPATVTGALDDPSSDVRVAAVRISERWLGEPGHPIQALVLKKISDEDWAVRRQLAASLGALPPGTREEAVASLLGKGGGDPVLLDAALSGIRGLEPVVMERLAGARAADTSGRDAALSMLAATIVRGGQDAAVQQVLSAISEDARPAAVRGAIMSGTEVALLGAAAPGDPGARRGAPPPASGLPCPTCPGGRAGPGGAYAFPRTRAIGPAADAERPDVRGLRLNRAPASFVALSTGGGELSTRAAAVLSRIAWPGKPGSPAAVPPLSAEEQQRFNAGQEVYRNVCQACHQPDGRGQAKIAASLVNSTLALARAEIPVRILLNGKEGAIGLMPPVGQVFSDEQIADVLTYIRREWGQGGSPVDPATVANVRASTAGRQRPWTDSELQALIASATPVRVP